MKNFSELNIALSLIGEIYENKKSTSEEEFLRKGF